MKTYVEYALNFQKLTNTILSSENRNTLLNSSLPLLLLTHHQLLLLLHKHFLQ